MKKFLLFCFAVCMMSLFAFSSIVQAEMPGQPSVIPPTAKKYGKSYAEWAAEWWQWYAKIPASIHPASDEGGENCDQGQDGKVWFLAGTGDSPAERSCTVPVGTAIFFPIINVECSTLEPEPFYGSNEEELRECVENIGFSDADELVVIIDGKEVINPLVYRLDQLSPIFEITIPNDNILPVDIGDEEWMTGQSVAGGYYMMLPPLSRGEHVIYFKGVLGENGLFPGFTQEVTYYLNVVNKK